MISILKNPEGYVYAYCEWRLVNELGMGVGLKEYMFVKEIWIHEDFRGKETLGKLIYEMDINPIGKRAKWVYWNNLKFNRLTKPLSRARLRKKGVSKCIS